MTIRYRWMLNRFNLPMQSAFFATMFGAGEGRFVDSAPPDARRGALPRATGSFKMSQFGTRCERIVMHTLAHFRTHSGNSTSGPVVQGQHSTLSQSQMRVRIPPGPFSLLWRRSFIRGENAEIISPSNLTLPWPCPILRTDRVQRYGFRHGSGAPEPFAFPTPLFPAFVNSEAARKSGALTPTRRCDSTHTHPLAGGDMI